MSIGELPKFLAVTLLSIVSADAFAADKLRILVLYTNDAKSAVESQVPLENIQDHAADQIQILEDYFIDEGLDAAAEVELAGVDVLVDYNENGSGAGGNFTESDNDLKDVADDINGHPYDADVGLGPLTENLIQARLSYEADVVIVVADPASACCGSVSRISRGNVPLSGDPTNFVAAVAVDSPQDDTWFHELMHLAGIAHENDATGITIGAKGYIIKDSNGFDIGGSIMIQGDVQCLPDFNPGQNPPNCERFDMLSNPNKTVTVNDNGTMVTVPFGDAQHDANGTALQTLPGMTQYYEVISNQNPPPVPNASAVPIQCNGPFAQFTTTWGAGNGQGGPSVYFDIEYRPSSSAPWGDYYEGGTSCIPFTTDANTWFRARALNSGGSSAWHTFFANYNCGSNQNGW